MSASKTSVYKSLRFRIITNDLAPGEIINEKELMDFYDIGRTPMREVLLELQRDGLIRRFPRSGTIVAPLDIRTFKESIEIRIHLEGVAGELAAARITETQLSSLRAGIQKLRDLEKTPDPGLDALAQNEFEFHNVIYDACHNRKLKEILLELHGICARFWYNMVFGPSELAVQEKEMLDLLHALEAHDSKATSRIMRGHLQDFADKIKRQIVE